MEVKEGGRERRGKGYQRAERNKCLSKLFCTGGNEMCPHWEGFIHEVRTYTILSSIPKFKNGSLLPLPPHLLDIVSYTEKKYI